MGYHLPSSYILALPLAPLGRYVLLVMNDMGWPCWPSIETLAKRSGIPRRTLQTVLGHLRKGGVSEVVRKVDVEVRRSGANRRRNGASPAPIRRTRCAVTAHGSETEKETEKETRRLSPQQLEELRATPVEADPEGTEYQSLAEAWRARRQGGEAPEASGDPLSILDALRAAHGAGVPPPAGGGLAAGGSDTPRAQARRNALRAGRLYA
jgi:DNA-binding IscR family transcriptional regulator